MSKVILICGKICSGKTYYTKQLKSKIHACSFSYDEMMEDLGIDHFDDKFDVLNDRLFTQEAHLRRLKKQAN